MSATEFTKNKVHFTIGLLAALFALHPFVPQLDVVRFTYMDYVIPISHALVCMAALLAGAVYFYGMDLMNEEPSAISQRLGNYLYTLAIMTLPLYAGMYASVCLEEYLVEYAVLPSDVFATPLLTFGVLGFWLVVWQLGGLLLRRYLTKKDWVSRVEQLIDREMDALKRGQELLEANHYDLAIIQYHKAVLTRLQMACMKRGVYRGNPIQNAKRAGLITKANERLLDRLCQHYDVAASPNPVEPAAAAESAEAAQRFLATVPV